MADERAIEELAEVRAEIRRKEEKIRNLSKLLQNTLELANNEKERLKLAHSVQIKELQLQVEHIKADLEAMKAEKKAVVTENATLEKKLTEQLERLTKNNRKAMLEFQTTLTEEKERADKLLLEEKERGEKERQVLRETLDNKVKQLTSENMDLRAKATLDAEVLKATKLKFEEEVATKDATILRQKHDIRKNEKLKQENDATVATLSEQLLKTREYLASKKQSIHTNIDWESCAGLPYATAAGQSTVINGKVYFGGGITDYDYKRYSNLVHCYSPTENEWTTLPPLPVQCFGLGQINGRLVAVGGISNDQRQATVYVYVLQKWKKNTVIPPMGTARTFPALLSLDKMLIVAGGNVEEGKSGCSTNSVEIFQQATSQWHQVASLPKACCNLSLLNSGDTIYALGGSDQTSSLDQVLCASTDDLLQTRDPTKLVWRRLQSTLSYQPPAAMLFGNLLAVGGWVESEGKVALKNIYMYSSTTNSWVYFSDLPKPCASMTCAALSATEFLVIGGRNEQNARAVYKGTLAVKA